MRYIVTAAKSGGKFYEATKEAAESPDARGAAPQALQRATYFVPNQQGVNKMTVISVIVGSTRQGRFSEKPAQWIFQHLKKCGGVEARLLDLRDFPMPFFDEPATPATPGRPAYENEVVQRWAAIAQSVRLRLRHPGV